MQSLSKVEHRLHQLGLPSRFWSRPEVRELQKILAEDETITNACTGRYEGGLALMVSTDRRLLLIDKKVFFLSLENVRYDMVSEVDYTARLLDSTIFIHTAANKVLRFTSIFHSHQLKALSAYVQGRVMEIRSREQLAYDQIISQQQMGQQFQAPVVITQPAIVQAPVAAQPIQQATPQPATRRVPMRPFKRIGSYPTASLTMPTMPEQFSPNPYQR
ncbi:MAG TPA: PH domain-containing protein [Patescibacteria group bacterium]|nr:PH domain-containing protein [Patescibacteria group bacterium]